MRILLDTHTFIWFVEGDPLLSLAARQMMEDQDNEILLSTASVWKMAIKVSLGKLALLSPGKSFEVNVSERLAQNGYEVLPISLPHVFLLSTMPFHHRAPFDRILVAQSLIERMRISV